MNLIKTGILNGVAVAVKVAALILLNKVLATYVGSVGYAMIGQFQNILTIVSSIAAGGIISTGVVKATAEYFDNNNKQYAVWRTAGRCSLITSLSAAVVLINFRDQISSLLFHRDDVSKNFIILALTLPIVAANNLLIAVINGKKDVKILVLSNISSSVLGLIFTGTLVYNLGVDGVFLSLILTPSLSLITTLILVRNKTWFKIKNFFGKIEINLLRELSGFGLMSLTSALVVPATHVLIRNILISKVGLSSAGIWQASWKMSEIYLMLVTSTMSVYYLPRIAEIRTAEILKCEICKMYRVILPATAVGAVGIFFLRDQIIEIFFTREFMPMRDLFGWQLFGDVIKIGSWVLGYIVLGRSMVRIFVVTEIAFAILFVILGWVCISNYGVVGASVAYLINYLLYWLCMFYIVKSEMRNINTVEKNSK